MIAYVLLTTETGYMEHVLEALKKIDVVEEAYMLYGVYDIVAKVRAENMNTIKDFITQHVRRLDNVLSTSTLIVTEETK